MSYNVSAPTHSLYIHWPFCPYKCHFCPFVALASHDQFMTRYHEALTTEIKAYAQSCTEKFSIETIYMGGGTPSTYPPDLLLDMFGILKNMFPLASSAEVTMEVNPGTVQEEHFMIWKNAGINRLSIGVQGLKDSVLKSLNRHQSAQDVAWLLSRAHKVFENLSIDLILGLPGVSDEEWRDVVKQVVTWPITHVSLYFLTVHENTPLYFKVQKNAVQLPPDDSLVDLYHWSVNEFERHGLKRYELSSFARDGFESRHNTVYWERKPFKGFGLGACSFDGTQRIQNEKNLMRYIDSVKKEDDITIFTEELTEDQIYLERLMLGLRRRKGVSCALLMGTSNERTNVAIKNCIESLKSYGLLDESNGTLTLTPKGLMLENEVVTQLSCAGLGG